MGDNEIIIRTIFSPANFNNSGALKSNFMRPKVLGTDEDEPDFRSNKLSVTRFNYSNIEECRSHARRHSKQPDRNYWGFARYYASEIRTPIVINKECLRCEIDSKPVNDNLAHANIVLPFKEKYKDGVPASPKLNKFLDELCDKLRSLCRTFKDPDVNSVQWLGENVTDRTAGSDGKSTHI